ncbi:hypothetical protein G6F23_015825 [Rhizopus arrhizus]|nr:hypothetical protein G6F23_015825 [Rhizopus arrhizus]
MNNARWLAVSSAASTSCRPRTRTGTPAPRRASALRSASSRAKPVWLAQTSRIGAVRSVEHTSALQSP